MVKSKPARRPRTRQTHPNEQPLYSDDDEDSDNNQWVYPLRSSDVVNRPSEGSCEPETHETSRNDVPDEVEYLPDDVNVENLPDVEHRTLPVVLDPGENAGRTNRENETETVNETVNNDVEQKSAEREVYLPHMSSRDTDNSIKTSAGEEELVQAQEFLHDQPVVENTGESLSSQEEEIGEQIPLTSLLGSQDDSQGDRFPESVQHAPVVEVDGDNSEQVSECPRRSDRLRRAPERFTYSELGNPFISFAQTILEGFNRVLVETFESKRFVEKKHEETHVY
ncbi:uncharacterized protein V6R79_021187 [Siganus canaliculatus]